MHSKLLSFFITVAVITILAKAIGTLSIVESPGLDSLTIRGIVCFLSASLVIYPVRLMLSGIEVRDGFFNRSR
jgi:hypothetical protein